jgi:hypothetical protein
MHILGFILLDAIASFVFFIEHAQSLVYILICRWLFQDGEKFRNRTMFDILFVRDTNPLTAQIAFLYQIFTQSSTTDSYVIPIDPAARFV